MDNVKQITPELAEIQDNTPALKIGGSTSSSLLIGKRNTDCVYAYIAGVRVYSRALYTAEIAQLAKEFHPTND